MRMALSNQARCQILQQAMVEHTFDWNQCSQGRYQNGTLDLPKANPAANWRKFVPSFSYNMTNTYLSGRKLFYASRAGFEALQTQNLPTACNLQWAFHFQAITGGGRV